MMMFGREAFQPFYVTLGTLKIDPPKKEVSQYIKDLVDNLGKFHETAKENLKAKQEQQNDLHYLKNYQNSYTVRIIKIMRMREIFCCRKQTMVKVLRLCQIFWCHDGLLTAMECQRNSISLIERSSKILANYITTQLI